MGMMRRLGLVLAVCLAAACDPVPPPDQSGADMTPIVVGDGGLFAFGVDCTDNAQCDSNLCTNAPYDRRPTPVCTYMCDPNTPNPKCPYGCNKKGYCKLP
jgi:hypothetical protein